MQMICAGHYQTETFGVQALARAMKKVLKVETAFIPIPVQSESILSELALDH